MTRAGKAYYTRKKEEDSIPDPRRILTFEGPPPKGL
jgi:hypothetical protein